MANKVRIAEAIIMFVDIEQRKKLAKTRKEYLLYGVKYKKKSKRCI